MVEEMIEEMIEELDRGLEYESHEIHEKRIIIRVKTKEREKKCPYCGEKSEKVYSKYKRIVQNLPIQGKTVLIEIDSKKMFCKNPECKKKTFVEVIECVEPKRRQTKRLEEKTLEISKHTSSITAAEILRGMGIKIGKSSICEQLKKNRNSD
jgi:transposase